MVRLVRFWPNHFFGDLMKFIIKNCARTKRTPITVHGPDHFKSPSYAPVAIYVEYFCSVIDSQIASYIFV